jgi:hypothetical protein
VVLLAAELVALILLLAADDVVHDRGPAATWTTSARVILAAAVAVALATWLPAALRGDIL